MIALAIVIIIIILCTAHFYLKAGVLTSVTVVFSAVVGLIVSFSYFETLGNFMISSGILINYALALSLIVLFALTMGIFYYLLSLIIGAAIEFGKPIKTAVSTICGLFTGYLVSGVFLIFLTLLPLPTKIPYERFAGEVIVPDRPKNSILNADGFAVGLYSWLSRGSLSGKQSFALQNAGFLDKIHLNRKKARSESIAPVASPDAVDVKSVRTTGDNRILLEVQISGQPIKEGGAADSNRKVAFMLAQAPVICVDRAGTDTGQASDILYPTGYMEQGGYKENIPGKIMNLLPEHFKGRVATLRLAYQLPPGKKAVLMQFKNNVITDVPEPKEETQDN